MRQRRETDLSGLARWGEGLPKKIQGKGLEPVKTLLGFGAWYLP